MKKIVFLMLMFVTTSIAFADNSIEKKPIYKDKIQKVSSEKELKLKLQSVSFTLSCGISGTISWDDSQIQPTSWQLIQQVWAMDAIYCGGDSY